MSWTATRTARRRRQAGFNLVEVMVSMVVLLVAVIGASKLQYATTRANIATRNRMHATEFLQSWIERVKMDAMSWQSTAATPPLFDGQNEAEWFHLDDTALQNDDDAFVGRMGADFWGLDVAQDEEIDNEQDRNIRYCVDLRRYTLTAGTMRADVRVWWHREGRESSTRAVTGQAETDRSVVQACNAIDLGVEPCPDTVDDDGNGVNDFLEGDDPTDNDNPHFYCIQASTIVAALN